MPLTYTRAEDGQFLCPHCGAKKANQSTMHYHLKKHAADAAAPPQAFDCQFCARTFLQATSLATHIQARHADTFFCPFPGCGLATKVKTSITIHYLRAHCAAEVTALAKPAAAGGMGLTCAVCSKICNSNTAFYYHLLAAGCFPCPSPLKPLLASRTSATSLSSDIDESQMPRKQ
jgi:hypothetical protein